MAQQRSFPPIIAPDLRLALCSGSGFSVSKSASSSNDTSLEVEDVDTIQASLRKAKIATKLAC